MCDKTCGFGDACASEAAGSSALIIRDASAPSMLAMEASSAILRIPGPLSAK